MYKEVKRCINQNLVNKYALKSVAEKLVIVLTIMGLLMIHHFDWLTHGLSSTSSGSFKEMFWKDLGTQDLVQVNSLTWHVIEHSWTNDKKTDTFFSWHETWSQLIAREFEILLRTNLSTRDQGFSCALITRFKTDAEICSCIDWLNPLTVSRSQALSWAICVICVGEYQWSSDHVCSKKEGNENQEQDIRMYKVNIGHVFTRTSRT